MLEFDDKGFIAGQPLRPDQWQSVTPGMPEGQILVRNAVPPGVFMVQNFLPIATCEAIIKDCAGKPRGKTAVGGAGEEKLDEMRVCAAIDVRKLQSNIVGLVRDTFSKVVGPHYGSEIEWFELPEILQYNVGGHYVVHADADNWHQDESQWKRALDRDLSILIYLNDDFEGGEIAFPNFGVQFRPKRGLLIAFPSDRRYIHTARTVTSGTRYAIVSWAAVKGTMRVQPTMHKDAIRM